MVARSASLLIAFLACAAASPALAQHDVYTPMPSSWVNSDGFRITNYTVRAKGAGCEGYQDFVHQQNETRAGRSRRAWASAEKRDGGVLCTDGRWYYDDGRSGGLERDVFIKGGKYFRADRR